MVEFFWWGDNENIAILKIQKRVIQIMCGVSTGTSYRQLLRDYKTLTVTFRYVLEVIRIIKMYKFSLEQNVHVHDYNIKKKNGFNPLPVQFKALLHGQKGCVFFSGHLNLRTTPETGLPSREKNHNN